MAAKTPPKIGDVYTNPEGITGRWDGTTWLRVDTPVDKTPKERSWGDAAISTGLRVVPAVAGGLLGSLSGPVGTAVGGAIGGSLGESLAELYDGTDLNPTQIALSGALNAIPTAKYLAKGGTAVLRTIDPGVERRLAGMLAPKAASVGAGLLDRINPRELTKTVAQSATTGAVVAPIENSASRYVQGQATTFKDFQRDMTLGALLGGATPAAGKILQLPFRVMAPTSGSGIPKILRAPEYADTETAQRANASNRAAGRAEKPTAASSAASRGYTGSISQQQDRALADLTEANSRIDTMLSEPNLAAIPLSDSTNLANQLRSLAGYFKGSQDLDQMARTAQRFANQVDGQVAVKPQLAHEVKKFLDAARNESSFKNDPSQLSSQAALVDLSNSVRSDLKTALPPIADLLDFESQNYDILSGLYKSGAKTPSIFSYSDVVTSAGLGGVTGYASSPVLGATVAASNLGRKAIGNSPRARARLSNIINRLAGNEYDKIPDVQGLPQTRGLLGAGAIPLGPIPDTSGVVPSYEPFVSRVQPRLPSGGSRSRKTARGGTAWNAGDPNAIPQFPPRTGGANQPGGFQGLKSPGGEMTPEQVPFTGSAPVGGRPSRGEPRVRTMSSSTPRIIDGVVVDELGNAINTPSRTSAKEKLAKAKRKTRKKGA